MFKTTIEFDEVPQLPTMEFIHLADVLVWQAFQDFLGLGDAEVATVWYNEARLDGFGFRADRYKIRITTKGYQVTICEKKK